MRGNEKEIQKKHMKQETIQIRYYDSVEEEKVKIVVIVAMFGDKIVLCRHKTRKTYEFPGGHKEEGENPLEGAKRELYEETGAKDFTIEPVCFYSVTGKTTISPKGEETFGLLCYAEIKEFGDMPCFEMEERKLFDMLPAKEAMTYPQVQVELYEKIQQRSV